ncbi:uncharacterized protein K460DRAFT_61364 [Cucurbitaria berberidis CBS 394.84]|uniref:Uncharacterized protein n=1 Tax=Cucurbitaria berberidis CBS 394.84 TaxID=1168544 RepID=A0A9P4LAQ0_9PLEO|nr:uncharacterized protein K460DRAFT_61364 [Cucurbitaria berberidis CBS 394.84]KAF1847597.1 hypothetical protein K460DRAFT_61364 [Cucurbitaria berberidis CBS 394.84]
MPPTMKQEKTHTLPLSVLHDALEQLHHIYRNTIMTCRSERLRGCINSSPVSPYLAHLGKLFASTATMLCSVDGRVRGKSLLFHYRGSLPVQSWCDICCAVTHCQGQCDTAYPGLHALCHLGLYLLSTSWLQHPNATSRLLCSCASLSSRSLISRSQLLGEGLKSGIATNIDVPCHALVPPERSLRVDPFPRLACPALATRLVCDDISPAKRT